MVDCRACRGTGRSGGGECPTCSGVGQLWRDGPPGTGGPRVADSVPGSSIPIYEPERSRDGVRLLAYLGAGVLSLLILLIPVGWWSEGAEGIRSFLEALPLGDAVAERRREEGDPVLIGILSTAVVLAAIALTTLWRRRAARSYVWSGLTFVQLYVVSVVRTLVIFGGLSLIPNVVAIANGTDLREDPEQTFTGPVWVILILLFWATFSYYGLRRLVDKEATRPPGRGEPSRERREERDPRHPERDVSGLVRDPLDPDRS